MAILPGSARWRGSLEAVLAHPGPLWVYGAPGTGVSTVAAWMAAQRGTECLDDADALGPAALDAWVTAHGRGVLGAHRSPEDLAAAPAASRCLGFRLQALDEDPASLAPCLEAMAREDGIPGPPPRALGLLPCPGNLKGLRNRLARWRLLGQFPDPPGAVDLPLETEDLAANLHVLERAAAGPGPAAQLRQPGGGRRPPGGEPAPAVPAHRPPRGSGARRAAPCPGAQTPEQKPAGIPGSWSPADNPL